MKASVVKGIRNKLCEIYPWLEDNIEEVWPSKAKVLSLKPKGISHVHFLKVDDEVLFMELKGRATVPMLKTLHKYPQMMKH